MVHLDNMKIRFYLPSLCHRVGRPDRCADSLLESSWATETRGDTQLDVYRRFVVPYRTKVLLVPRGADWPHHGQ